MLVGLQSLCRERELLSEHVEVHTACGSAE